MPTACDSGLVEEQPLQGGLQGRRSCNCSVPETSPIVLPIANAASPCLRPDPVQEGDQSDRSLSRCGLGEHGNDVEQDLQRPGQDYLDLPKQLEEILSRASSRSVEQARRERRQRRVAREVRLASTSRAQRLLEEQASVGAPERRASTTSGLGVACACARRAGRYLVGTPVGREVLGTLLRAARRLLVRTARTTVPTAAGALAVAAAPRALEYFRGDDGRGASSAP